MSGTAQHFLVIERIAEDPADWVWRVEHPEACGWPPTDDTPVDAGLCAIGCEVESIGLDSLGDDWHSLSPGRYEVRYWSQHYPSTPWNDGEEWDGGLEIVEAA